MSALPQQATDGALLSVEHLTMQFGGLVAINDVSLTIHDQEFLVLLGPSGCGKTTLLRAIAGLGIADRGRISINGQDVTYLPPGQREISMVFQSYAIFPHMTVRENIGFGLKMNKVSETETKKRVDQAAELFELSFGMFNEFAGSAKAAADAGVEQFKATV